MRIFPPICLILFSVMTPIYSLRADTYSLSKDIAYLGANRSEKLDVYQPPARYLRPLPAVIWIHGGGWTGGDKAQKREVNVCKALAEAGYVAISINYKLGPKPSTAVKENAKRTLDSSTAPAASTSSPMGAETPWPQNLYDCKSALRFLRKEAKQWGIDPDRIAVSGGSAGGHLALMVGLTADAEELNQGGLYREQINRVSCIVDFYGVAILERNFRKQYFGTTPQETESNIHAASPATYLRADSPPILIVHGTGDGTVPVRISRDFAALLKKRGIEHEYIEIPGAPHSFDLQPKEQDLRPVFFSFLARHLGVPRSR